MAIFAIIKRLENRRKIHEIGNLERSGPSGDSGSETGPSSDIKVYCERDYELPAYTDIIQARTAF